MNDAVKAKKNISSDYKQILKNPMNVSFSLKNDKNYFYHLAVLTNQYILDNPVKFTKPIIIYRGIKVPGGITYKVNDIVGADRLMSASLAPVIAYNFFGGGVASCCFYKIKLPVGFPAFYIKHDQYGFDSEDELLLPFYAQNQRVKYRIKSINLETINYIPFNYKYQRYKAKNFAELQDIDNKLQYFKKNPKIIKVNIIYMEPFFI